MINFRSVSGLLFCVSVLSCAAADAPPAGGGGNTVTPGSGGSQGQVGMNLNGGGGSSGFEVWYGGGGAGYTNNGTGGNMSTAPDVAAPRDSGASETQSRACLTALGDAPSGAYDWKNCCPNEAATAMDWCTHYAAFCKFNYPVMSNLSPGAVPLKDMADCLARFPPLTVKSRACRSNFLCEDSNLGQPNPKTCDFPDLNRRKCDGL
jgi:hypothetical protein